MIYKSQYAFVNDIIPSFTEQPLKETVNWGITWHHRHIISRIQLSKYGCLCPVGFTVCHIKLESKSQYICWSYHFLLIFKKSIFRKLSRLIKKNYFALKASFSPISNGMLSWWGLVHWWRIEMGTKRSLFNIQIC